MIDDTVVIDAEAAARALLDRRIELIRELTAATSELEPLQRAATEGEQRVRDAWTAALAGGWTADELRGLGLPEPDRKVPAKKATPKPRTATPPQTPQPPKPEDSPAPPAAAVPAAQTPVPAPQPEAVEPTEPVAPTEDPDAAAAAEFAEETATPDPDEPPAAPEDEPA
ncbi:hypothetical protein [Yinghuangia seranimata]|uniref:hypothetical protein n=1 Tax=Yinghuangia seranimata TaxID=408067 RepID=UPI00248AF9AA|nr:hypothetical protein [Yinghuangia seranimata]MDI2132876.1 hypothetical protein [Yinghuangia seranimata]